MKPIKTYKDGGVQVVMWPTNNGGYSYQITKRYKDKKTEEWRDSKYLYKSDLEKLIPLLQEAVSSETMRTQYDAERTATAQPEKQQKYELPDSEIDDLPF